MGDAGVAEQLPVLSIDSALVADGEGGENAGGAPVGHVGEDGVAHTLAQPRDRESGSGVEHGRRRRVAHIAGRADALLEQQQLVVEAVRVQVAMRLAQANGKAPALAGAQLSLRLQRGSVFVVAGVPAQRKELGQALLFCTRTVESEAKAGAARPLLRQTGDHARDHEVAALEFDRQDLSDA